METLPNISMVFLGIQHNNGDQRHMIIDVAPDGSIKIRKPFTIRLASGLAVDVVITLSFRSSCGQAFATFADNALDSTKPLRAKGSCEFPVTPCYFKPQSSTIPKDLRNRCTLDVCVNDVLVESIPIKVFQKSTGFGKSFLVTYSFQLTSEGAPGTELSFKPEKKLTPIGDQPPSPLTKRKKKEVAPKTPRKARRVSSDTLPPLLPATQRNTEAGLSASSSASPSPSASPLAFAPSPAFTPSAFFQTSLYSYSPSTSSSPPSFPPQSPGDCQPVTRSDENPWCSDEELAFESIFSLSQELLE